MGLPGQQQGRHPALVPVALAAFEGMRGPNQLDVMPATLPDSAALLELHRGPRTEVGAREAIRVGVQYLAAWIGGRGAVPLYGLMEDAATAEIARSQLWQWIHNRTELDTGDKVTPELVGDVVAEEYERLRAEAGAGAGDHLDAARKLLERVVLGEEFADFLTVPAYDLI